MDKGVRERPRKSAAPSDEPSFAQIVPTEPLHIVCPSLDPSNPTVCIQESQLLDVLCVSGSAVLSIHHPSANQSLIHSIN
jgi:hypothetical protein